MVYLSIDSEDKRSGKNFSLSYRSVLDHLVALNELERTMIAQPIEQNLLSCPLWDLEIPEFSVGESLRNLWATIMSTDFSLLPWEDWD